MDSTHARAPLTDEPPQALPVDFPSDPPPALGVMLVVTLLVVFWSVVAFIAGAACVYLLEH